jgi:glycosyltransferase involved in cell wall biosynthesis
MLRRSKAFLAYGSQARAYLIEMGASPEDIFTAQNAIALSDASDSATIQEAANLRSMIAGNGASIILYVGALEERKRIEILFHAVRELLDRKIPAKLCLVGAGRAEDRLRRLAAGMIPGHHHFAGSVHEGIERYFLAADVFALPSEGGLAINQAMGFGLPVVASSADGTEVDLIADGEDGFLVPEGSLEDFAGRLEQLLVDPELRKRMGQAARRKLQHDFTVERMVDGMQAAVRHAISGEMNGPTRGRSG